MSKAARLSVSPTASSARRLLASPAITHHTVMQDIQPDEPKSDE